MDPTVHGRNPAPVDRLFIHYLQGLYIPGGAGFVVPSTVLGSEFVFDVSLKLPTFKKSNARRLSPRVHLFGHVHEGRGMFQQKPGQFIDGMAFFCPTEESNKYGIVAYVCLLVVSEFYVLRPKRRNCMEL